MIGFKVVGKHTTGVNTFDPFGKLNPDFDVNEDIARRFAELPEFVRESS